MAKTKEYKPRRVRSEEERGSGSSDYLTLDEGEKFLGYALFEGNPAEDELGYYEYMEHWNQASRRSIPCAGDDCPFCEDGDKPKTRAKTLWLVTRDAKGNEMEPGVLMIFNFNFNLIKQFTELRGEDEKIKGRQFRIAKLDDRGNYSVTPKTPILKAAEVKAFLKDPGAPDFDALVTSQLRKAMEGVAIARALDDDDEPEDDEPKKGSKSKAAAKKAKDEEPEDEEPGEWPSDGLDEETVVVVKVDKDGNFIEVTHEAYDGKVKVWATDDTELDLTDFSKGDLVIVTTGGVDDDGDFVMTAEPEAADADAEPEEGEGGDLPDSIEGEEFEVVSVDASESTMEVKSEELELEFTLYFLDQGPASEVDFDDYEEGTKIVLAAEKDSQGDMVATEVPEVKKAKAAAKKGGKATGKKSTGKKAPARKGK